MNEIPRGTSDNRAIDLLHSFTVELWGTTLLFYVLGDLITTVYGLQTGGVAEVGPVVAPIVAHFGLWTLYPMKFLSLVLAYMLWRLVPAPIDVGVPLGLTALGLLVTGWNIGVLLVS